MRKLRKGKNQYVWLTSALMAVVMMSGCGQSTSKEPVQNEPKNETNANQNNEIEEELTRDQEIAIENDKIAEITEEVEVIDVIDGSTAVVINEDGEEETVKLLLIETPDNIPEEESTAEFGIEAYDLTQSYLDGSYVLLERGTPDKDENGYTLGHIWLKTTEGPYNFSERILLRGLGKVVDDVDASNMKYLDEFREYEQSAKEEAAESDHPINIWAVEGYVTDDGFDQSIEF
ncbi:thermonuclease family protein [Salipaludibacillus sp. LMS25]|jgi:micrococcal nuclease|uniref:thermonuclease family protein n=1 Tax=Salipaludibacillus sp. LMS25 TaxID=2924031 RepID=UPI0020D1C387|nr:thermonuclease family protein [Salipaludibacillus sp. LMS25]UTR16761.1 thermonuclease family protein [Salipaludibacillus sp. LMS25]